MGAVLMETVIVSRILRIDRATNNIGFFAQTGGSASIANMALLNVNINSSSSIVGGLVGNYNGGMIRNSYVTGDISAVSTIGGLIGGNDAGTITNSYAAVTVNSNNMAGAATIGGLVGNNDTGVQ